MTGVERLEAVAFLASASRAAEEAPDYLETVRLVARGEVRAAHSLVSVTPLKLQRALLLAILFSDGAPDYEADELERRPRRCRA